LKTRLLFISVAIMTIFLLVGCAASSNPSIHALNPDGKIAGFWMGLWHGVISPITFMISLFTKNVNIYEVYNNGNWYNFGFILGAIIIFGSGGRSTSWKAKKVSSTTSAK